MKSCFECGSTDRLHEHHVVPESRGGTRTVTVCQRCHNLCHHANGNMLLGTLLKEANQNRRLLPKVGIQEESNRMDYAFLLWRQGDLKTEDDYEYFAESYGLRVDVFKKYLERAIELVQTTDFSVRPEGDLDDVVPFLWDRYMEYKITKTSPMTSIMQWSLRSLTE